MAYELKVVKIEQDAVTFELAENMMRLGFQIYKGKNPVTGKPAQRRTQLTNLETHKLEPKQDWMNPGLHAAYQTAAERMKEANGQQVLC